MSRLRLVMVSGQIVGHELTPCCCMLLRIGPFAKATMSPLGGNWPV